MRGKRSVTARGRNKLLVLLAALGSIAACQASEDTEEMGYLTSATAGNVELTLYEQEGRCAIRVNDDEENELLGLPYPCGFKTLHGQDSAQSYHYENVGEVFVVAGPVACRQSYEHAGRSADRQCSNYGQALIVNDGDITMRFREFKPVAFCHDGGFDKKDFYHYAYPEE